MPRIAAIVEFRLHHHVGVRLQEFEEGAVVDLPLLVQPRHDPVVE